VTAVVVPRPERRPAPEMPSGELVLDAPPEIPPPADRQWSQSLTMLPMVVIMAAFVLMFSGSATGNLRLAVLALFAVAIVVLVVVAVLRGGGASSREIPRARRTYLRGLSQHRRRMARSAGLHRDALAYLHPDPDQLWAVASGVRLWERRAEDADFAVVRIGVGPQQPATALVVPETKPLEQLDPLSALALRRFVATWSTVPGLPLALPLTGFGRIHLRGDRDRTVPLIRAMLAQLVTVHAPDDVLIAVCPGPGQRPDWDWVKWLPHALHPQRTDLAGPVRLVSATVTGLEALLAEQVAARPRVDPGGPRGATPQIVVVLDGGDVSGSAHLLAGGGLDGVTVLDLGRPAPRVPDRATLVLDVGAGGELAATTVDGYTELGRADALDPVLAEALARRLAPARLGGDAGPPVLNSDLGLADLLGLTDPYAWEPDRTWTRRPSRDHLRVMFGVGADGAPVELDLKESAQTRTATCSWWWTAG
jgi:DNA segregation ATPase FtsK/SpoIIIE, S-DNA-T family